MTNKVSAFTNSELGTASTVTIGYEQWFIDKEVTNILGYQNGSRDINRNVDEDDSQKLIVFDGNQMKETIAINESGLYNLILRSKFPSTRRFKH